MILRYLFVKNLLLLRKTKPDDRWFKVNLVGLFLGILSAFGLSMVANFQVIAIDVQIIIFNGLQIVQVFVVHQTYFRICVQVELSNIKQSHVKRNMKWKKHSLSAKMKDDKYSSLFLF